jgi:internalin A
MVDDSYTIRQPKEWWVQVLPWLKYTIEFLKFAIPLSAAGAAVYDDATAKKYENQIKLLEQMVESLPSLAETSDDVRRLRTAQTDELTGAALRALYHLLDQLDPSHYWQNLNRIITPYGGILWLCPEHRREYEARSLENY